MNLVDRAFFAAHGYACLGQVLAGDELEGAIALFDRDRRQTGWSWRLYENHQTTNCDALVTLAGVRRPDPPPAHPARNRGPDGWSGLLLRDLHPPHGR